MKSVNAIAAMMLCAALFSPPSLAAPAGTLDPTFGVGGKLTVDLAEMEGPPVYTPITAKDSAGRIYLMGEEDSGDGVAVRIARVRHNGALDTTFGIQGSIKTALPLNPDATNLDEAIALGDGRIMLGFRNYEACRLHSDGSLDTSFGNAATPGCANVPGLSREDSKKAYDGIGAMLVDSSGRITLVGYVNVQTKIHGALARLMPDGAVDQEFGNNGFVIAGHDSHLHFNNASLAPNGDVVIAGSIGEAQNVNDDFMLARFAATDGKPVNSFGEDGVVVSPFDTDGGKRDGAFAVTVLPNGDIVAAGYASTSLPGAFRPAVIKLKSNGTPDVSFGPEGKRTYDPCAAHAFGCDLFISDIALSDDDRLVLGGWITPAAGFNDRNFLAMRITPNGLLDSSFGDNPDSPGSAVVQFDIEPDGEDLSRTVTMEGRSVLMTGTAEAANGIEGEHGELVALARLDHGLSTKFDVTPAHGEGGTLSPFGKQIVRHSDRAEFEVFPDPGYAVHAIGNGPANCGGGMDGNVYVTAPIVKHCIARVTFKPVAPDAFADSFE